VVGLNDRSVALEERRHRVVPGAAGERAHELRAGERLGPDRLGARGLGVRPFALPLEAVHPQELMPFPTRSQGDTQERRGQAQRVRA
jgi:hypothetical protein